jgi:hypothetical protein
MEAEEAIARAAERIAAQGESRPVSGRDPINLPMIRHWVDALDDRNPIYTDEAAARASVHGGLVAPPAMLQVWTMPGLHRERADARENPLSEMLQLLDSHGYTSVIATNCEQTYHRYLRPGEQVSSTVRLELVKGPKRTALGEGYFVTSRVTWHVGDEPVGQMLFRVLKFRPPERQPAAEPLPGPAEPPRAPAEASGSGSAAGPEPEVAPAPRGEPYPLRPVISRDTEFFWAGLAARELRIQRCAACGALRHPPGPFCPQCHATDRDHVVAGGRGEIYSYVVHHHPPVPGKASPFVVAVVALPEGVRMIGNVTADPRTVRIGMPVQVEFERVDDDLVLPAWRPADPEAAP